MGSAEGQDGISEQGPIRVFVYGTLKRQARRRGGRDAFVFGQLYAAGIPAALPGEPGDPRIRGIVYEVSAEELRHLDGFEGIDRGIYRRQMVRLVDGSQAWMYAAGDCMLDAHGALRSGWKALRPDAEGIVEWNRD